MRGRESAAPAFLPSGKGHGGAAPVSRNGPRRFCRLSSPIRHYFPDCWAVNWSAAGAAHGNCTPPRISPSCTDCLYLSLCRSTIVGRCDHGEAACRGCFWMNGYRWAPSDLGPALTRGIPVQVVMARSPHRRPLSYGGSSADVIQLPNMAEWRFSRYNRPFVWLE